MYYEDPTAKKIILLVDGSLIYFLASLLNTIYFTVYFFYSY